MKIPKFPQDFHYPKDAVPVKHKRVQEWIRECVKELEENEDCQYHFIQSGDTKVTVYRLHPEDGLYEIIVSKNEYSYTIFDKED